MKDYSDRELLVVYHKCYQIINGTMSLSEEIFKASLWMEKAEKEMKKRNISF